MTAPGTINTRNTASRIGATANRAVNPRSYNTAARTTRVNRNANIDDHVLRYGVAAEDMATRTTANNVPGRSVGNNGVVNRTAGSNAANRSVANSVPNRTTINNTAVNNAAKNSNVSRTADSNGRALSNAVSDTRVNGSYTRTDTNVTDRTVVNNADINRTGNRYGDYGVNNYGADNYGYTGATAASPYSSTRTTLNAPAGTLAHLASSNSARYNGLGTAANMTTGSTASMSR